MCYWLIRRDCGIGGRESSVSTDTSRKVWVWAEYQESVKCGTEGEMVSWDQVVEDQHT